MSNRIDEIIKTTLNEYIERNTEPLLEMATIGKLNSNGNVYTVSVHGNTSRDRQTSPHMHAITQIKCKGKDNIVFNLEFSLTDILTKNELTILRVRVGGKVIVKDQTTDWSQYTQLKKDLEAFLFEGPVNFFGVKLKNNLHLSIWQWNNEYDYSKVRQGINVMRLFIEEKGLKPLEQFSDYLLDLGVG